MNMQMTSAVIPLQSRHSRNSTRFVINVNSGGGGGGGGGGGDDGGGGNGNGDSDGGGGGGGGGVVVHRPDKIKRKCRQ